MVHGSKTTNKDAFAETIAILNAAGHRPALFVFGTSVILQGSCQLMPTAAKILDALRSKSIQYGYKIALISGEGPGTRTQVLDLVEEEKLRPDATEHIGPGEEGAYDVFSSLRNKLGAPFSEWIVFSGEQMVHRAATKTGAVVIDLTNRLLTTEAVQQGLDDFGRKQLEGKGF